jgi:SulP family sulfate permease
MDITGIQAIEEVLDNMTKRGVHVVLCEANTRVRIKLERAGLVTDHPDVTYTETLHDALGSLAPVRELEVV